MHPMTFQHRGNVTADTICANIRQNAGRLLPQVDFKRICVCGSGPSLKENLDTIRELRILGFDVASMNGSHNFLIENGIVPDFYFQVDARSGVNLPFLALANDHTTYVIASQCDPEVFAALEGRKVMLWHVDNYEGAKDATLEHAPSATIFGGACNVGHSCLGPITAIGYRILRLFGFDGPTRSGEHHAFAQPQNDGDEQQDAIFQGRRFFGSPTSAHDAQAFVDRYRILKGMGIDIEVIGDGLLPTMVKALGDRPSPHAMRPMVPAPQPRSKPVEKLQIVCWKWKGHIPYTAEHVNRLARMVGRWLDMPHEMVCITDDPEGIDGGVRIVPMWHNHFAHGYDWHRLRIFAPEMAEIIGPRFVSMDLDTVICGPIKPIFDNEAPFKAWRDPNRANQYCTALFQMDAGAFPHVFDGFDVKKALALRHSKKFTGYDQAWISEVLPDQPVWTRADGVLSFKGDVIKAIELPAFAPRPLGSRIINFHGKFDPSHSAVQECCPWITEFYR